MTEKTAEGIVDPIAVYDTIGLTYAEQQNLFNERNAATLETVWQGMLPDLTDKVVADIGCGQGNELLAYAEAGTTTVYGVEPSRVMRTLATEATEHNATIEILAGDFSNIPLPDESLDIVTARYALHILSDLTPAFREVARILKPGGTFLIAVAHPDFDAYIAERQHKEIGERIDLKLFGGKVTLNNGTHTMTEYMETSDFTVQAVGSSSFGKVPEDLLTDLIIRYQKSTP
jgi:ubiquinone/menaquinone biosynthesis C-methylase UbiE